MSIASCTRPSERASSNVSISCSGLTPATGMMRFTVPTKFELTGELAILWEAAAFRSQQRLVSRWNIKRRNNGCST